MPEVLNRKNIFVKAVLDATGAFTFNINVPFHVDDMIVTSWTCGKRTGTDLFSPLIVNMQGIGEILCFTEQDFESPRHIFNLNTIIRGQQIFTIRNASNAIVDQTGCEIMFCLEFIEFRK
jgi:hypothetical protein